MAIGMKFHHFADPKPPKPNFKIVIPSRLSPRGGTFKLVFYVPESYLSNQEDEYRFPFVINFHGGGFTLGTGTDDARWAATVIHSVEAVFVSVEYRLAPEYPFSVGVEDGTDALIYLASHAEELRLDPRRIALSGFSAGGNFAFTVPLMHYDLKRDQGKRTLLCNDNNSTSRTTSRSGTPSAASSTNNLQLPRPVQIRTHSSTSSIMKLTDLEPTALEMEQALPDLKITCIVSFYPPTDFRESRETKRATNSHPEMNLPPMLTNMFDTAYLSPHDSIDLNDPYLSPAAADDNLLNAAYPENIVLYTAEYDMLNAEGTRFGERLSSLGKTVHGGLIKAVPHAFDKKPNPLKFPESANKCYSEACAELRRIFGGRSSIEERTQLEQAEEVHRFEDEIVDERTGERRASATIANGGLPKPAITISSPKLDVVKE